MSTLQEWSTESLSSPSSARLERPKGWCDEMAYLGTMCFGNKEHHLAISPALEVCISHRSDASSCTFHVGTPSPATMGMAHSIAQQVSENLIASQMLEPGSKTRRKYLLRIWRAFLFSIEFTSVSEVIAKVFLWLGFVWSISEAIIRQLIIQMQTCSVIGTLFDLFQNILSDRKHEIRLNGKKSTCSFLFPLKNVLIS